MSALFFQSAIAAHNRRVDHYVERGMRHVPAFIAVPSRLVAAPVPAPMPEERLCQGGCNCPLSGLEGLSNGGWCDDCAYGDDDRC